jgi:hypothetical protein
MNLLAVQAVYAQGTVTFDMRTGTSTHIWGPASGKSGLSLIGYGTNDSPPNTIDFASYGMTLFGANGTGGQYGAASTLAQLLDAVGPLAGLGAAVLMIARRRE